MKDENKATSEVITEEQLGEVSGGFDFKLPSTEHCYFTPISSSDTGLLVTKTVDEVMWVKCQARSCTSCACNNSAACAGAWHKQGGCSKY
ncbi:MAG: hypothetical protein FWG87_10530 [Defluviitaleaceae bacterium]|nr:hypothetical protein [Defluviitaleaceae bacterium]